MSREYIPVAGVAKLVRQSLKEAFPSVKFSVRSSSYSMGSSIDVRWVDGPNSAQVHAVVDRFNASYFDGMIDYKGSIYHEMDGKPIRFNCDSVHCARDYSDAMIGRAIAALLAKSPGNFPNGAPAVEDYHAGKLWSVNYCGEGYQPRWNLQSMICEALGKRSQMLAKESPLAASVKVVGDDGYGAGTIGMNGAPVGQGYPRGRGTLEQHKALEAHVVDEVGKARVARELALLEAAFPNDGALEILQVLH